MHPNKKLIAEILHTARRITVARDALLAGFEMTSAKVRLLRTVKRMRVPFTISQLACAMDVSRQTTRVTVHELAAAGFVYVEPNDYHKRAPVVVLSSAGSTVLEQLRRAEQRWLLNLTRGFDEHALAQTEWVIRALRERLRGVASTKVSNILDAQSPLLISVHHQFVANTTDILFVAANDGDFALPFARYLRRLDENVVLTAVSLVTIRVPVRLLMNGDQER